MKFLPTINVWNSGITDAILSGQLKLQCGQWIQCGGGVKSRFISCNGRSINAVHGGSIKEVNDNFKARLNALKIQKEHKKLLAKRDEAQKELQEFQDKYIKRKCNFL